MNPIKLCVAFTALILTTQVQATPVTSGLQLWLDATDSSTVFDASGLTPDQAGFTGSIALWTDKSGASRNAAALQTLMPTYAAEAFNGRPTITFGGDSYFDLNSTISSSEETVFIVTRMFNNGDNEGPWIGNSTDVSGLHGVPGAFFNDADRYFVGTEDRLFGNYSPYPGLNPAPTDDTIVMEMRSDNQVSVLESGSTVLSGLPVTGTMQINTIGWFPFGNRFFYGEISEILFYDRALTPGEVIDVQNYLGAKYAVPVPEPETWAMLLAGLGLVGMAARRQRRWFSDAGPALSCSVTLS